MEIQPMDSVYLGPSYTNEEIKKILDIINVKYSFEENPALYAAKKVANNKVVGWFQGRMEIGPRALGNRSILANASNPEMRDLVNQKIKFRDSFRPFCPSVLEEDSEQFFVGKKRISPHMTINYDVDESVIEKISSVVHVDKTARIQTVNKNQNELYYKFLTYIKDIIGVGVCLNTSFNINNEPIVNTPREAIATFFGSGMDCLSIGNYILEK
jgi:carbamoyltransferase